MLVRPNIGVFTQPISFIGLPVVAVPVWTDGVRLPIGVQIIAPPWREDLALRVARALEREGVASAPVADSLSAHGRESLALGRTQPAPKTRCARDIWRALVEDGVNVGPAFDRIPNFVGADMRRQAAQRTRGLESARASSSAIPIRRKSRCGCARSMTASCCSRRCLI